ncbi:MAG: D-aminoacylase [Cyclobacteriaceae bacterium]|nr:D-aminoacylase [Cyclobacteriaceae bacterium]
MYGGWLFAALLFASVTAQAQPVYDLLIRNGRVYDGTGNSWFNADIGINGGRIVFIGRAAATAVRVIDARGLVVSPGFVDVHTHIEGDEKHVPTADNFIHDGVTSVVTGNCGMSEVDLARWFYTLDSIGMSVNVASLVGHNDVRRAVMGDANREPSASEMQRMEDLVEQAMKDGAVGISTGLIYVPGTYSKPGEVIALAKAAAKHGGVYASHIRNEGDQVTEAIEEAVNIGREAKIPVEISHFKVTYKPNWGRSVKTLEQIVKAREEGIDVTIDQYPYVASSTTLNTTLPTWVFGGGPDSVRYRLKKKKIRAKIVNEMVELLRHKQLEDYSYALIAMYGKDTTLNGKTITEANIIRGKKHTAEDEAETILEMVGEGSAQMVYFSMNEDDLAHFMKYPFNMPASDAGIAQFGSGMPHPRTYGTNARVLGRYVREKGLITLGEAIRRMTSLPAGKFQLQDRGLLRVGMAADILVFDDRTVSDPSTFQKPHAYSTGFHYVIVNGQVTVDQGRHTGVRSGRVLKGPGAR